MATKTSDEALNIINMARSGYYYGREIDAMTYGDAKALHAELTNIKYHVTKILDTMQVISTPSEDELSQRANASTNP